MTPHVNRRGFLAQATVATTALTAASATPARAARANLPKAPTDKVTLGKTGIQVSLVGMGTGSHGSGICVKLPSTLNRSCSIRALGGSIMNRDRPSEVTLVGLRVPGVVIKDPGCVAKTYPNFFSDLERLRDAASPR